MAPVQTVYIANFLSNKAEIHSKSFYFEQFWSPPRATGSDLVGESEAVAWFFSRVVWFGGVVRCFLLLCGSAAVVPARRVWGSLVGAWIEGPLFGWSRYFFL
jgi:hypothetical protein